MPLMKADAPANLSNPKTITITIPISEDLLKDETEDAVREILGRMAWDAAKQAKRERGL